MSWNLLNLVSGAVMHGSDSDEDDSSLTYAWLSDGTLASVKADDGTGSGVQKRYMGSFVYTSDTGSSADEPTEVESIAWDEGRILFDVPYGDGIEVAEDSVAFVVDTVTVWVDFFRDCWFAGDHLGNVRAVIDITEDLGFPQVLEQSDYLPSGTKIQNPNLTCWMDNRWQYAGKEAQRFAPGGVFNQPSLSGSGSVDLGLLNFGARMYDPFTARWTAVDPMAKNTFSFTPYSYCTDNSINRFDPDGNAAHIAIGAIVGAAIEGGIAVYNGKSTREIVGAMARGAIEGGVIAATLGVGTGAAIAYGAAASAAGSIADQAISNGSIDAKQVLIDTAVGSVSSGLGELSNAGVKKATTKIMTNIEDKYASSATKDMYRNEIKKELKSEGKHVRNEKLNQMVKNRIDVNSQVDRTIVDASDKVLRYSVELIYDTSLNQLENMIYERP